MTLGTHSLMLCFLSLIVVSWNQPVSAVGWVIPGLEEKSYEVNDRTALPYHSRVQYKPHQNYYPDFGHRAREPHTWHDHYVHKGYDGTQREGPHQRDEGRTYFPHRNHRQGEEESSDMLSRRIYDDGYVNNGPQFLGDAEGRKTGQWQNYRSSHLKSVMSPIEKTGLSKKLFKRRKREDIVEISEATVATEAVDVITEEIDTGNAEVLQDAARAFTRPNQGGGHVGKRLNGGHGGKGHGSHRGPTKPKTSPSPNAGNRNNTQSSDFVFPDSPIFTPKNTLCAGRNTFCEDKEEYPNNYIKSLLQREGQRFRAVFGQDTILDTNITVRGYQDETELCTSTQRLIFPTKAKNKDEKWQFVVNQEGYTQGIVVETCLNLEKPCQMTSGFPLAYRSICKQKYITRRLLSLNENGGPGMSEFLFPSCCVCVLQSIGPGVASKRKS